MTVKSAKISNSIDFLVLGIFAGEGTRSSDNWSDDEDDKDDDFEDEF